ncbi:ABC transporter ATP-binding protein [Parapusillimonas granuli]|uniref:ABC transporter ATP-binding protein n=1 Tax=Parapusillimonas granuli TaxID=380911 RepID=A0A853G095_9BURK|nr:ABC transporter ATP-binding protein [Parapusillimonas granuli]MBB5215586.1 peptide/nickel transport system ATP-binding protein [Parapusillimonas granuli]NYT49747.1 ABC transporter ATP-binding protein [Parapusillimonas granuli]
MEEALLDIQGLTIALPAGTDRKYAVSGLSMTLRPNEVVCIIGESGSGKSMTARAVMGLLPKPHVRIASGKILFKGRDLVAADDAELRRIRGKEIAMIFQEPMTALNPVMKIGRQIGEVFHVHQGLTQKAAAPRVKELLDAVKLPDPERIFHSYPHQLSGGQRQRAMIAMALAMNPSILIADEPTTALDVMTQAEILRLLKDIQEKYGTAIIFVTHDFGVVADIADRVLVMQLGNLVESGTVDQVLEAPTHSYTQSLIKAIPKLTYREGIKEADQKPVILNVKHLHKAYFRSNGFLKKPTRFLAVNDVSFTVRRGETLGIVGESGSGKSTIVRCLTRLIASDQGVVEIDGTDVQALSRREMRRFSRRIQMVFQDPYGSLNPHHTVGDLIAEGPIIHGTPRAAAHAKARELLDIVGLGAQAAGRYPHEFSGGQRQRVGLARALALDPEVLIADEPVSALDVSVQAQILKLLTELRDQMGLAMVFVTHDLRVASQVSDTILVMRYGEVVESGPGARIFSNPAHQYTRDLLAAMPGLRHGRLDASMDAQRG